MKKEPVIVDSEEDVRKTCQIIPGGFAGTGPNGSFFESPGWVDKTKPPGLTSLEAAVAPPGWWINYATGKFLFFSPNLAWLSIALIDYFFFPHDYQAAKSFQKLDWVLFRYVDSYIKLLFFHKIIQYRFAVNFTITFGYFGFWHCILYLSGLGWSKQPFHPNRRTRSARSFMTCGTAFLE